MTAPPYAYECASVICTSVNSGKRLRRSGRISLVQSKSTISSCVNTEYASDPLLHRSRMKKAARPRTAHGRQPMALALFCNGFLLRSFKFMDEFLRFLDSLFVEGGTDQNLVLPHSHVCYHSPPRQKQ